MAAWMIWWMLAMAPPQTPCAGPPSVFIQGGADNFAGGPKPAALSPALASYDGYTQYRGDGQRQYDELGANKVFATSFPLTPRKLCSAELEVKMRRRPNDLSNDALWLGFAPFLGDDRLDLINPWAGISIDQTDYTLHLQVPVNQINRHILTAPGPYFLDLFLHDDTAVDYIKLTVYWE